MDYLKLRTEPHLHSYTIGWIKKGPSIKVTALCHVPIPIGKFYQDSVAYDIVDIDKCHILLGRPWQHDIDATHKSKENMYMFTWKGKKVSMRTIPPTSKSTKEKAFKLVSMCN